MQSRKSQTFVLSLGGSIIIPAQGIDFQFLKEFNLFIRNQISEKNRRFFIVCGGGKITRDYQQAGAHANPEVTNDDLDWLGTHATHLNGHLIRTIFRDIAFKYMIIHYDRLYQIPDKTKIVVGAGWKPGWSTDYDAVLFCRDYGVKTIINMSNIDMIYDKDPSKFKDAKPIKSMNWDKLSEIVGDKWTPGLNAPFDPAAVKLGRKLKLKVVTLNGKNLENLAKCLDNKPFIGTVIHP